jgi:hypothetical protein
LMLAMDAGVYQRPSEGPDGASILAAETVRWYRQHPTEVVPDSREVAS